MDKGRKVEKKVERTRVPRRIAGVHNSMRYVVPRVREPVADVTDDECYIHRNGVPTKRYNNEHLCKTLKWTLEPYRMVHEDKARYATPPGSLRQDIPPPDDEEWGVQKFLIGKGFPKSITLEQGIQHLKDISNDLQWQFKAWAECHYQRTYQSNYYHYPNARRAEARRNTLKSAGGPKWSTTRQAKKMKIAPEPKEEEKEMEEEQTEEEQEEYN